MVQMTHARIYHPATQSYDDKVISARDYHNRKDELLAQEAAGEIECHCPDPHCDGVRVTHYDSRLHTYYGHSGQPYRLQIPNYFQRRQHAKAHHANCEIVKQYGDYTMLVKSVADIALGQQSYRVNVNIPTNHGEGPHRKPRSVVDEAFERAARQNGKTGERAHTRKPPLSHGVKTLSGFGHLIEFAAYDPRFRQNLSFHVNGEVLTLEQLYQEDSPGLFQRARASQKLRRDFTAAVTVFKPAPREFWHIEKEGPGWISGIAQKTRGRDGHSYNVCTALHVANRDLFFELKKQFAQGYKSFLVYSEKIAIDREEIRARNAEAARTKENKAFFVHAHISRNEQIMPWTAPPPNKELDFGKPMFQVRPPRGYRRTQGGNEAHIG